MTLPTGLDHRARIVSQNVGQGFRVWQFLCSCGCASTEGRDKWIAIIARRNHLRELAEK